MSGLIHGPGVFPGGRFFILPLVLLALWVSSAQPDDNTGPDRLKMVLNPGSDSSRVLEFDMPDALETDILQQGPMIIPMEEVLSSGVDDSADSKGPLSSGAGTGIVSHRPLGTDDTGYPSGFTITAGYRQDSLNYTIAGINDSPNIVSELDWDPIHSFEMTGTLRWCWDHGVFLKARAGVGFIMDGENRDSDYDGDNRTHEFSRSVSDTDDGYLYDGSLGLGQLFDIPLSTRSGHLYLIPMAGYSCHVQALNMTNGVQVLSTSSSYGDAVPLGPFSRDLDASYDAWWHGPWLGLDLDARPTPRHGLSVSVEYHWADYEAEADWNLRTDLQHPVSFRHEADGQGFMAGMEYTWSPCDIWSLSLGTGYRRMKTGSGIRTAYLSDGSTLYTKFNGAKWESWSAYFGLTYCF